MQPWCRGFHSGYQFDFAPLSKQRSMKRWTRRLAVLVKKLEAHRLHWFEDGAPGRPADRHLKPTIQYHAAHLNCLTKCPFAYCRSHYSATDNDGQRSVSSQTCGAILIMGYARMWDGPSRHPASKTRLCFSKTRYVLTRACYAMLEGLAQLKGRVCALQCFV
ncbi:hypothetical protein K505DRAFT_84576 [Melanomma pulvis-pyrius CBS 109.77]|uniref:Uncharacterized protein n=1 Tax=Melanomma pulvis-pyrius CBS 109.77 TaxID=1314802 RepID=A0A6A6X1L9_9PLEO|nr:hypothetical protein K505DRAFT_84576 [Melanomma pulvis-pyrius CBS 109.77]